MQIEGLIPERNVQVGVHSSGLIHGVQEHGGYRHLKHGLLHGGQAQIPVVAHLGKIVQKADEAKAQGQYQHKKHGIIRHGGQIAHKAQNRRENEHQAAHNGSAGLIVVPGGADLPDGGAGLQGMEHRQQKMSQCPAQGAAHHAGNQNTCHIEYPPFISLPSGTLPAPFPDAFHGFP